MSGSDAAAIEICRDILREHGTNPHAVDSAITQLLDFGHHATAEDLFDQDLFDRSQIAPEVLSRMEKNRAARVQSSEDSWTWRRLGFRERGEMPRVLWFDSSFARWITVCSDGIEIKRILRTCRFPWSEVSEVTLEPCEATAAFGYSTFTYKRVILKFERLDGVDSIDVSNFRPEFADPNGIIEAVRRFCDVQERPIDHRSRRAQNIRRLGNVVFVAGLIALAWFLNR